MEGMQPDQALAEPPFSSALIPSRWVGGASLAVVPSYSVQAFDGLHGAILSTVFLRDKLRMPRVKNPCVRPAGAAQHLLHFLFGHGYVSNQGLLQRLHPPVALLVPPFFP